MTRRFTPYCELDPCWQRQIAADRDDLSRLDAELMELTARYNELVVVVADYLGIDRTAVQP